MRILTLFSCYNLFILPNKLSITLWTSKKKPLRFFLTKLIWAPKSLQMVTAAMNLKSWAADYVVHLDPWWNPAVEDQASDRAHRLGQKRPVTIYRFVTAGSVEEKIIAMHQEKRELAADFLEGTATSVTSLSDEELLALLQ